MTRHGNINWDQTPLHGVVLCCTSIPVQHRDEIAATAAQMGAVHKIDLTADVTHLIVGNTDTPKYKYVAKERQDIKVLSPEWLDAARNSWLQGGETDVSALEQRYRLPSLLGLQICVTGFDDLKRRNDIAEAVEANGARYHGDLTKQVTHLIAAAPKGKKYEYAGHWGIKTIAIEWLNDSLKRGMVLDETFYNPTMPPEERGNGAVTQKVTRSALGKRNREDNASQAEAGDGGKRKLRRTTSSKLQSQNGELWADIGSGERQSEHLHRDQWAEPAREPAAPTRFARSRPHYNPHTTESEARPASDDQATVGAKEVGASSRDNTPVFKEQKIYIQGFDPRQTKILEDSVSSNGAEVMSQVDMESRSLYLEDSMAEMSNQGRTNGITCVVPHDISSEKLTELRSQPYIHEQDEFATECWVEKCIFLKTYVDKGYPLCNPLNKLPIKGFEDLTICPTSFVGIDLLHLSKAVKLAGANYNECLQPDTSVLVCSNETMPNALKLKYALEHRIPIVRSDWMWECINTGQMQSFEDFSLTARKSPEQRQRKTLKRTETAPAKPASVVIPIPHNKDNDGSKKTPKENSQPLQELDRKVNSPNKTSARSSATPSNHKASVVQKVTERDTDSNTLASDENGEYPTPVEQEAPGENEEIRSSLLNDAIAELRAHKAKDTLTLNQNQTATSDRRHRPLGRAISNPSSLGGGGGPTLGTAAPRPTSTSKNDEDGAEEHEQTDRAQSLPRKQGESFTFHPSQALTYEREESTKMREMLGLGGGRDGSSQPGRQHDTQGGMQRVESIGKVKDLTPAGAGAVESVGRRRQRRAVRPAQQ